MIFSRTSQYAIQALVYMAMKPPGEPVLAREIAHYLAIPPSYLAKLMQTLVRGGLLESFRGRQGGFCLKQPARKTPLLKIVRVMEGIDFSETCLLGLKECSDETACPMHAQWKPLKERILKQLQEQTLEKLARDVKSGKYRIADLPADSP